MIALKKLSKTLQIIIAGSFKPSPAYTFKLVRIYIDEILAAGVEDLHDALAELVSSLQPFQLETSGYLVFDIEIDQETIPLKLKMEPRHNEVGLRMWEAGFLLTEFLLAYPPIVRGRGVAELGAGLGLTGLVASYLGASKVALTDCSRPVLENLRLAVEINSKVLDVRVAEIDWSYGGENAARRLGDDIDVVLAADVLYDPTFVPSFVDVVETLVSAPRDHAVALIAVTFRNPATLELFFTEVRRRSLPLREVKYDRRNAQCSFVYNSDSVRLYAIGGVSALECLGPGCLLDVTTEPPLVTSAIALPKS